MRWCYKTVNYALKKEGLLGSSFLDENEIEMSLNQYGKAGWELVNMIDTMEGVTAVFKQPLVDREDDFVPAAIAKPVPRARIEDIPEEDEEVVPDIRLVEEGVEEAIVVDDVEDEPSPLNEPAVFPEKRKTEVKPVNVGEIPIN